MKKLVIFDCDGTLVDSEVIATKVFTRYWATHGVNFTEDEFKEKFIGTGKNAPIVIETFSKMPEYANEEGDRLLDEELERNLCAVEGMVELVSELSNDICVASNSSLNYVKSALKKTKLDVCFNQNVFSAEQVKNPKPSPDLFLFACSELGYEPYDCIVIEDSVSGIKAAQNANMKVISFSGAAHFVPSLERNLKLANATWHCSSVSELKHLLLSEGLL
ncbi:MAG: HAD family phosphatase [Nanoarchaeota archaeon]|nr:HAD family phosphatase [Nanoarchaeota archaeon]